MNAQSSVDSDRLLPTILPADEHTHLLSNGDPTRLTRDAATATDRIRVRTQVVVILFVCVLYLNLYLCLAPEVSIREGIICKSYYAGLDRDRGFTTEHPEPDCTVVDVQRELNLISQWYVTIAQLPGFLLVFPYGVLADRIGRRKVLLLSVVGIVLCDAFKLLVTWLPTHFSLRAIWLAPLFRVIGGGDAVAATVVLAAVADAYTEQDRTTVFARVASMATACELLAPLIGSVLMLESPWIPVLLGFAVFLMGSLVTLVFLPETLIRKPQQEDALHAGLPAKRQAFFGLRILRNQIAAMLSMFGQSLVSLLAIKNVGPLLFGFFAATVGTVAAGFELQYVHKRFGWSYAYANSILAIRPSIILVVLLVLVPLVSKIMMDKFQLSSIGKDFFLLRVSAALLSAGTLLLSLSATSPLVILSFVIFAFGNAFTTIGKSLLTTFGPPEMAGTLLSAMNFSASLGAVIAGPIIAVTYDWGLKQGGIWVGAPLFVVALLYLLTLGSVCLMRLPSESVDSGDVEDDAEENI